MKTIALLFTISVLLTSCMDLRFTESMPANNSALQEFPQNLRGTYVGKHSKDTIYVDNLSIRDENITLGENTVLKPSGKYYILNTKKDNLWNVSVIKPCGKNTLTLNVFDIADGKKRKTLNTIAPLKEVYDEDGSIDYIKVSPTDQEFQKMLKSKGLVEIDRFKKIKS